MRFLAGDIGGTKTLFALYELKGNDLTEVRREKYVSHEHKTFDEIVELFLKGEKNLPHSACFGIAGPIENEVCHTTNLPWVIDSKKLCEKFNMEKVSLINDLKANAYGIKTLQTKDLYTLNKGVPNKNANQALISAGTGLGESPIFFDGKDYIPSASEGGHCDFSPRNDIEIELLKYLQKKFGHVSFERVLCGQGLVNLYQFLIDSKHEKVDELVSRKLKEQDPAKVISELGLTGECKVCARALSWFCSLYGAEAGNVALKVMSLAGVYIGGGIAPKILSELKKETFMKAFIDKGRFSNLLKNVPIYVILDADTALKGAAYYCQKVA